MLQKAGERPWLLILTCLRLGMGACSDAWPALRSVEIRGWGVELDDRGGEGVRMICHDLRLCLHSTLLGRAHRARALCLQAPNKKKNRKKEREESVREPAEAARFRNSCSSRIFCIPSGTPSCHPPPPEKSNELGRILSMRSLLQLRRHLEAVRRVWGFGHIESFNFVLETPTPIDEG